MSVVGVVNAQGKYPLEPGMRVLQAIARAGGVSQRGSTRRVQIKRLGANGVTETHRAKDDELVQADDIIVVKESWF